MTISSIVHSLQKMLKKSPHGEKSVPQRLKPQCKYMTYGTAEAVPLSRTRVFPQPVKLDCRYVACGTAEAVPLSKADFSALERFF